MEEEVEYSFAGVLARYFAHGVAFSILLTLLVIAWVFLLAMLMMVGYFIGLILGFIILFIIIGGLNNYLANALWGIKVKGDLKTLLFHGMLLFIILLCIHGPAQLVISAIPSIVTSIVIFVIAAFADGFVGRTLALLLEEEVGEDESTDESDNY
jgi:hypothetical protein